MIDIKNLVSDLISAAGGDTVSVLEVPPGVGKTLHSINESVELASKGVTIVFALPTHASALTAFAYAVNAFYDLYKSSGSKRLPYVIYYEGVNRYCPIYRYKTVYRKAIEYAKRRWWIDNDEYEKLMSMTPEEAMNVFGWSFVCRKLCPLYKNPPMFGKVRLFVPNTFAEVEKQVLTGEGKIYVKNAVNNLAALDKAGLVYRLGVHMDFDQGKFTGCCVRILLNKSVIRGKKVSKVQVYTRGALIITPTSGVDYLLKSVVLRINNMAKRGANVPTPIVVLDEYDTYFYKPAHIPVFTAGWVLYERKLAERLLDKFKADYASGNPIDVDTATAAAIAKILLDSLVKQASSLIDEGNISRYFSVPSMILEVAAEEILDPSSSQRVPAFRPRPIFLQPPEKFVEQVYVVLKNFVAKNGLTFINPYAVKRYGLWYFLQIWEWVLANESRKRKVPYQIPALIYMDDSRVRTGFMKTYKTYRSMAKWLYLVRKKGATDPQTGNVRFVIAYKATGVYGEFEYYEDGKYKKLTASGYVISIVSYDARWYNLFGQEAKLFLTSATGLPWGSDFFRTRTGIANPLDPFTSSMISYLEGYKYPKTVYKKDRTEFIMEPAEKSPIKKTFVIVGPHIHFIMEYAKRGKIDVEDLKHLPPKEESRRDPLSLQKSLNNYRFILMYTLGMLRFHQRSIPYNLSVMALAQRKEIAAWMAIAAIEGLSSLSGVNPELYVCTETKCVPAPSRVDEIELAIAKVRASHILIRGKVAGVERELRVYATWFRSRLCRGVDLPDEDILTHVLVVGSPFRPPSTIDYVYTENILDLLEIYSKAGRLEIQFIVANGLTGREGKNLICVAHTPIDISEGINELIQAYGRGLRRAWRIRETLKYKVKLIIPYWLRNKFIYYCQLWVKEIYILEIKMVLSSGSKRRQQQQRAQQQQQTQQQQPQQQQPQQQQQSQQQQPAGQS